MKHGRDDYNDAIQDERIDGIPKDEPVFLLRGQDMNAGDTVRVWARLAEERGADKEVVANARQQACAMDEWPKEKVPDLPTTEEEKESENTE